LLTDEEVRDTISTFRNEMMAKQMAQMKESAEKNKKEGGPPFSQRTRKKKAS